jgi:glutaredoxin
VKEFLSKIDREVEFVNVQNNPEGMRRLHSLGASTVPVVCIGNAYVHALNVEDVAKFIGISNEKQSKLSPDQLIWKLDCVIARFANSPFIFLTLGICFWNVQR